MPTKCTMLFQQSTINSNTGVAVRVGGWSESWYSTGEYSSGLATKFRLLCARRAILLPTGAAIVGQRYQKVAPVGASVTSAFTYAGVAGRPCDVPQIALFLRTPSRNFPNIRPVTLRGVPDARVVTGEYANDTTGFYDFALRRFFEELTQWNFRGFDRSVDAGDVFSVDAQGVVLLKAPYAAAVHDIIHFSGCLDINGIKRGGNFHVTAAPGVFTFTVGNWPYGLCQGGKVTKRVEVFPAVGEMVSITPRVIVRKVGRPFGSYRGRASKRR